MLLRCLIALRAIEHMFGIDGETVEERRVRAHALVDRLLSADVSSASGAELTAVVEGHAELAALTDGAVVGAIAPWEASADWALDGTRSAVVALVNRTGAKKTAAGSLRRTALDAASMPHVSAAAAAGWLPLSHLTLLTRARRSDVAEVFDRDEAALVDEARTLSADALDQRLVAWRYGALAELERNEPDPKPDHASDADTAKIVRGFAGRGLVTLDLTPETLAAVVEATEARIETWRRQGQLSEDTRTWEELVGAAIKDLIADGAVSSRRGQIRPLLIATARLTELFDQANIADDQRQAWTARILGGGPIGRAALQQLMEQANIQLVITDDHGEPLHVSRAQRLATAAMLIALFTRAGTGCEFPGCHATHHRSHAHHITWWEHGGNTSIDNLTSCEAACSDGPAASHLLGMNRGRFQTDASSQQPTPNPLGLAPKPQH